MRIEAKDPERPREACTEALVKKSYTLLLHIWVKTILSSDSSLQAEREDRGEGPSTPPGGLYRSRRLNPPSHLDENESSQPRRHFTCVVWWRTCQVRARAL